MRLATVTGRNMRLPRAEVALGDSDSAGDGDRGRQSSQRDLWRSARSVVDRIDLSEALYPSLADTLRRDLPWPALCGLKLRGIATSLLGSLVTTTT